MTKMNSKMEKLQPGLPESGKAELAPCDRWLSGFYGKMPFEDYTLLDRSARTLLANTGKPTEKFPWSPRRGIMPSTIGFRGMWNWDTAFAAVGAAYFDPQLAREQIEIFLDLQQSSGLFPDVCFENGNIVKGFGKPPVMAWAAWRVYETEKNTDFLRRCYAALVKNEAFWRRERGGDACGLFHYDCVATDPANYRREACFESGWDNSVRWDDGIETVWAIDLNCFMIMTYRALANMADALGEDSSVFRGREKALTAKVESTLWSEDEQCYLDYDFKRKCFVKALTPASFMPLYIGIAPRERAEAMASQAKRLSPGWPSVSYDNPQFDPAKYWRGPTWYNVAYFALKGLRSYGFHEIAETGKATLLNWTRQTPGQFYENYNPLTGAPSDSPQFSWTAVFVIEFLLDW